MKLRICFLLALCVVGITGQVSEVSPTTPAAAAGSSPATAAPPTPAPVVTSTVAPPVVTSTPATTAAPAVSTIAASTAPPTAAQTSPTVAPTAAPTVAPTAAPTSVAPTGSTPVVPTGPSTVVPTGPPTVAPTGPPTVAPTGPPTVAPTGPSSSAVPTAAPTAQPSGTTLKPNTIGESTMKVQLLDKDNKLCIKMEAEIEFTLSYLQTSQQSPTTFKIYVPSNATVETNFTQTECPKNETDLTLSFLECYNATLVFNLDADKTYGLKRMRLDYLLTEECFPGAQDLNTYNTIEGTMSSDGDYSKMTNEQSYRCDTSIKTTLHVANSTEEISTPVSAHQYNGSVVLTNAKFMAFQGGNKDSDYSTAVECNKDFTTSDIVPIAVGCALAALVVIVLIAYLIGRRRSRQKGYQSV